jgi:hypothetical protein
MKRYFHKSLLVLWIIVLCEYCVPHIKAQGMSCVPSWPWGPLSLNCSMEQRGKHCMSFHAILLFLAGVSISPGNFQEISIPSGQVVLVTVSGIPTTSGFTILHAHAVLKNISLSFTTTPTYGQSATGSSVGLLINGTGATAYVINPNTLSVHVLLGLETYDKNGKLS